MRIPRLFIDVDLISGESINLPKDKAHHLAHVLRMHTGDLLTLFNNTGYEFKSTLLELTRKNAIVQIRESIQVDNESPLRITLCLAIARGQHMDYAIQKAVELGVHKIIPVMSEFSNVKLQGDRVKNKMIHWQNIIISAAEQCGRSRLTELMEPTSFSECLVSEVSATRLILHPGSQTAMPEISVDNNELLIVVGPEGGFSDIEVNEAKEKKIIPISLGPRTLRVETAVVSALSNAQQRWGDLN